MGLSMLGTDIKALRVGAVAALALGISCSVAFANLTEDALKLGADKSVWDELKDEGGIRDDFFGISVRSVNVSFDQNNKVKNVFMIVDPNTPPKSMRASLSRACAFDESVKWDYSNDNGMANGSAIMGNVKCGYVCQVGVECNVFIGPAKDE